MGCFPVLDVSFSFWDCIADQTAILSFIGFPEFFLTRGIGEVVSGVQ